MINLKSGGLGSLGAEQLEWMHRDVTPLKHSTPIVVFAHIPLWSVYPEWGWGTDDSEQALGYLKKFGSVTVLNGHIHQTMQKVEVPAERLRSVLGVADLNYLRHPHSLAIVDSSLA